MDLKKSFEILKKSDEFRKWKENNEWAYLYNCFVLTGDEVIHKELTNWQFGFYDKKKDDVTSFVVGEKINMEGVGKAFKKESTEIFELKLNDVRVWLDKAFEIASGVDEAKGNEFQRKIVVLQNFGEGAVWNLSFITDDFSVLNVKISAKNGKILSVDTTSLISFKAG